MDHREQENQHGKAVKTDTQSVQDQEIIAYFSSLKQAQRAANSISGQAQNVLVEEVPMDRLHEKLNSAQAGISVAKIGVPAWLGLALGLVAGIILGMFVYSNRITLPGITLALSAGPVAVSFLLAGVLGSIGWFAGTLVHLLRVLTRKTMHEVRAIVSDNARSEVERKLLSAGALDVLVAGSPEHT